MTCLAAVPTTVVLRVLPCPSAAVGSSRASSVSTTPGRSLSPFHLQQTTDRNTAFTNHYQQPLPAASAFPLAPSPQQQQQQQQGQAVTPGPSAGVSPSPGATLGDMTSLKAMHSVSSAALADVVIMDGEGGMLHYQAPVEHAAAAAAQGRVPVGSIGSGGLRVYAPHGRASQRSSRHSLNSGSGSLQPHQQQQLAPGRVLTPGWPASAIC
jgi:hypothetical protein